MSRNILGMTYLPDDPEHYAKVYETYTQCSDDSGEAGKWVVSAFNARLIRSLVDSPQKPAILRLLSIGSGKGNIDCAILEKLLPSFHQISNTVVEPSEAQLRLYRRLVDEKSDDLEGASFVWRQQTFDEYLDEVASEGASHEVKFNLVTAIHVLYYATDMKGVIQRLYDMLEEGGILFIVMSSDDTPTCRVCSKMNEFQKDLRPQAINDGAVRMALDDLHLPYETERVPLSTRVSAVFNDENSEQGNAILDFMTHTVDFRKTAPTALKDSVLRCISSPEFSKQGEDGEMHILKHWTHFIVKK